MAAHYEAGFYSGDRYLGRYPDDALMELSKEERCSLVYDYIVDAYDFDRLARETADGKAEQYILAFNALSAIWRAYRQDGQTIEYGGITWDDGVFRKSPVTKTPSNNRKPRTPAKKSGRSASRRY